MGILRNLESRATAQPLGHPCDLLFANWLGYGDQTAAGVNVTANSAMQASAVYSCVRVLSEALASLPLILYRRLPNGGKERATDHPLYRVTGKQPNGWQSRFDWIEQGVIDQCLRGAAYSRIKMDNRGQVQLIPMAASRTVAKLLDTGKLGYEYTDEKGRREILLQEEVLRVPFMTSNGITPLSVIAAQREAIGSTLAAQDYSSRFFANDARPTGGLLSWEGGARFKDEEAEKDFRANWQAYMGGENRHRTAILKPGMSYQSIAMSNDDAQFLETRKFQRSEIAGFFRVPPHMIGDMEAATFSNIDHQAVAFVVHTMGPWLARWEPALDRDLLTVAEQEEYFFEFNVDGLLRGDPAARAKYYQTAILTGWMNRNEVRAKDNLATEEGLNEFIVPSNMQASEMLGKEETPPAKPDGNGGKEDE